MENESKEGFRQVWARDYVGIDGKCYTVPHAGYDKTVELIERIIQWEREKIVNQNKMHPLSGMTMNAKRSFETGACRDASDGKLGYAGCFPPECQLAVSDYLRRHSKMPDGSTRSSSNWQKGMPVLGDDGYEGSLLRHLAHARLIARGHEVRDEKDNHIVTLEEALCATMFNVQGWLFEELVKEGKAKHEV